MKVICTRIELKPDSLPAVRAWAREVTTRKGEVLETLRAEGVTVESVFLDRLGDTDYLVYYMRARDLEHAFAVGPKLKLPIQEYHNQFKRETWELVSQLECLADFTCPEDPGAGSSG
jgi:hypothetical protein